MNSDGLPDIVKLVSSDMVVYYNSGSGFGSSDITNGNSDFQFSENYNSGFNISGTGGGTTSIGKLCFSLGADKSKTFSIEKSRLMDFNNDGYTDIVSLDDNGIMVEINNLGKENMLKKFILF